MQIPALYYFPGNNKKGGPYPGDNVAADISKFLERRLQKTKAAKKKGGAEH